MHKFFRELLEYTFYFNEKVIYALIENPAGFPENSLKLLNHTINAQEIWNARILEQPIAVMPWEIRENIILAEINILNYQTSLKIVDTIGFEKIVNYKNSRCEVYSNYVKDMLFHIVNHSTYHRAQIATDFKLHGLTPLVTDYIFYKRDRNI